MKINTPVTNVEQPFPKGKYIVSRTDLKGALTYVNDTFVEISGFTREELIGKNHNMVRHPDMPPAAFENLWQTIKSGRPWRGMVKNRCNNGDFYWVEALVVPVRKDTETIGYMSVRTEPTRQQVSEAEALYRQLKDGKASLPLPSAWMQVPLAAKLACLVTFLLAAQLLAVVAYEFGPGFGWSRSTIEWIMRAVGISAIGVGISLFLMQRQIMVIVNRIIGRIDRIAQGNLTDPIPLHRVDELGRLNDGVVTMQTHLKAMMAEIAEASNEVSRTATDVGARMAQTQTVAQSQSDAATQISTAVGQLSVSVEEVTSSAQLAAEAVGKSENFLTNATGRMDESREASRNVVGTVKQAEATMSELFQSIFAIGRITAAIKEISDQTNLLALNAAIEAARAGEQGRGFAVVADEVRKLAEKASKQTEEISNSVREIQNITQAAVSGMEQAGSHVVMTEEAMARAQQGLDEVRQQGESVVSYSRHIAERTREQSLSSGEISRRVTNIADGLQQSLVTIAEVNRQTETMTATAEQLRRLIGHFRFIR